MKRLHTQRGVSLVEMIVGLALGLVLLAGVLAVFGSQVASSYRMLGSSKLQQELNALMLVMSNDIRRAGYWASAGSTTLDANPFSQVGSTVLEVHDDMTGDTNQVDGNGIPDDTGTCVVYAYDATYRSGNTAGLDNTDLFGFRLNNGVVEMRQQGDTTGTTNSCANGTWQSVSDSALITITALTFDLQPSQCLNVNEPNGDDEADCYTVLPSSGDVTVEVRELLVTLSGQLANEPGTSATVTQTVKVRNDLVRIR